VLVDGVEELQSSEPNNPTLTDNFGGFFNVPEAYPTYNGSKTPEYWDYWIGLVAWNWPNEGPQQPGGNVVLQPVFTWQEQYTGGPHAYYMFSDMAIAGIQGVSSFKEYSSGVVEVYLGDRIESFIYQYESNPDAWQVRMDDLTTGAYAQFLVTGLPSTWPKFNTAYLVLEGFDGTTAAGPLPNCADLPSSGLSYELATFDAPPNYTPSTPNWSGAAYPATTSYSTTGPNCNFGYEYSGLELTFTQ
jgi:hypothetical protein